MLETLSKKVIRKFSVSELHLNRKVNAGVSARVRECVRACARVHAPLCFQLSWGHVLPGGRRLIHNF